MRPDTWSTSYLLRWPLGISMVTSKSTLHSLSADCQCGCTPAIRPRSTTSLPYVDRVRYVETRARAHRRRRRDECGTLMHKVGVVFVALTLVVGLGAYFGWIPQLTGQPGQPETGAPDRSPAAGRGLEIERPPRAPSVLSAFDSRPVATRR